MKPFIINRDSWHYRLNKSLLNEEGFSKQRMQDYWEPRHNNFCSYWRATVFRMIWIAIIVALIIIVLSCLGYAVYMNPWGTVRVVSYAAVIVCAVLGWVYMLCILDGTKKKMGNSLFVQKYKVHKSKICPEVEYD